MSLRGWNIIILILVPYVSSSVWLKRFEQCEPRRQYTAFFNVTIKNVDRKQYADGSMILRSPLDNTVRFNISVEMLTGKNYVYMFSIVEKKACNAMHKLLGEFEYALERSAQLIPRMCPIPQGRYQVHDSYLDFTKLTIMQTIPFGQLRFIGQGFDKKNDIFTCLVAEIEKNM